MVNNGIMSRPTGVSASCKDVIASVCLYDHTLLTGFDVRFTSPVYPGENITTDMWVDGDTVSFRCRVVERDITALNNGKATLKVS